MAEATLKLDLYADLDDTGVNLSVFFGDDCDPSLEKSITWPEIVSQHIETYTIPSKDTLPYESLEELEEPFVLVRTLRAIADNIEDRLMALNALDRAAWLRANDGQYGGPTEPFIKPLKEVLNID